MGQGNEKLIKGFGAKFELLKNKQILSTMENTAWDLITKTHVPIVTHNLWDSIGCGIYHNGILMKISYPSPKAEKPRSSIYGIQVPKKDYWGKVELEDMVENPPVEVSLYKGWCLYYVAAMPYSQLQEDKGVDVLRDELIMPIFRTHIHKL